MGTQLQILQAVMDIVGTVQGIKEAPDYPPDQLSDFPFAVAWPSEGTHQFGVPGERLFLGNIVLEIHVSLAGGTALAVENSIAYGDTVPDALMKFTTDGTDCLGGTADTFEHITQTFGALGWAGKDTLGYRFIITNIKARTALS